MKLLAMEVEKPNLTAADFEPHLASEAARVWELTQANIIREIYFNGDEHTAVIVLECDNPQEARGVLGTLPLVEAGLITFNVIPLIPYPGFARLFGDASGG